MFLFLLKSLHSLGRNILVYFAPFVLIMISINLNITNPKVYKDSLIQNNFYTKLSLQATQIVNQNQQVNSIIGKNFEFITDTQILQKNTEQNIDNLTTYLNGEKINNLIPQKPFFENLQPLDILPKLRPEELIKFKDSLSQVSDLNISSFLDWQKIPIIAVVRSFIQNFRWQINFLGYIYFGILLITGLISPLFAKNLFQEFGIILSRIGFSVLFGIGVFLVGILGVMWSGSLFNQYLLPVLNIRPVIELISWQIFWISYSILSFAIYFGIFSLGTGYFLKKVIT